MEKLKTGWDRPLARVVNVTCGWELRTLRDAAAYMLALEEREQREVRWQSAVDKLMEAADGGDIEAVTAQIEFALMMGGKLVPRA
jgi:hypothetical protein